MDRCTRRQGQDGWMLRDKPRTIGSIVAPIESEAAQRGLSKVLPPVVKVSGYV